MRIISFLLFRLFALETFTKSVMHLRYLLQEGKLKEKKSNRNCTIIIILSALMSMNLTENIHSRIRTNNIQFTL